MHVAQSRREIDPRAGGSVKVFSGPSNSAIFERPSDGTYTHNMSCPDCGQQITVHVLNAREARKKRLTGYLTGAAMIITAILLMPIMVGSDKFPAILFVVFMGLCLGGFCLVLSMLTYSGVRIKGTMSPHKTAIDEYRPV